MPRSDRVVGEYTGRTCIRRRCDNPLRHRAVCGECAKRIRCGVDAPIPGVYEEVNPTCSARGCGRISAKRGHCEFHYRQGLKAGRERVSVRGDFPLGGKCLYSRCENPSTSFGWCRRHYSFVRKYDIPAEVYIAHLDNPVCENPGCGEMDNLHVDHDHTTGEFRGFLCQGCNTSLGRFKDDLSRIEGLALYLERRSR